MSASLPSRPWMRTLTSHGAPVAVIVAFRSVYRPGVPLPTKSLVVLKSTAVLSGKFAAAGAASVSAAKAARATIFIGRRYVRSRTLGRKFPSGAHPAPTQPAPLDKRAGEIELQIPKLRQAATSRRCGSPESARSGARRQGFLLLGCLAIPRAPPR